MPDEFEPIQTAEGWQQSNPPILSLAAIRASLSIFDEKAFDLCHFSCHFCSTVLKLYLSVEVTF